MSLTPVDTTSEVAVSDYLSRARDWLATAVELTGPEQIAMAKAEIATAAEATKQLGLSKEIQLDAQEMVRRAEYALGKAIRKGQAEGTIAKRGQHVVRDVPSGTSVENVVASVDDYFQASRGRETAEVFAIAETSSAEFDAAIEEAKAEGNLSRANVARKAKEQSGTGPSPRRTPLVDDARALGLDVDRLTRRVQRLANDDRLNTNKQQVAPRLRSHLENAIEVYQDLLDRINN